jgi:hypothetical protein
MVRVMVWANVRVKFSTSSNTRVWPIARAGIRVRVNITFKVRSRAMFRDRAHINIGNRLGLGLRLV